MKLEELIHDIKSDKMVGPCDAGISTNLFFQIQRLTKFIYVFSVYA
jgi:hypothetical protein